MSQTATSTTTTSQDDEEVVEELPRPKPSYPSLKTTELNHGWTSNRKPRTAGEGLHFDHTSEPPCDFVPSLYHPPINKWRGAAACVAWFVQGMNDSVPGALLPYIESAYHTSYSITALIFVGNAVGFIAAAPLIDFLDRRLGRARVLAGSASLNVAAYAILIAQPPFPVVVVCFVLLGFGFSIILALDNSFVANLQHGTELLGIGQGAYGVGGTVAPLIGTAMASHGVRWSFFYFISLALSILEAAMFAWSFWGYTNRTHRLPNSRQDDVSDKRKSVVLRALANRTTLLACVYVFAYQGAEVTISGWVVSFLIDYRNGNPAHVGYVTSGFWGGITVGRFVLCPLIPKLGDRRCLTILVPIWACFHLLVWFVPNVIGDAVTVAVIGLVSGPIAPCATGILSRLLDPEIQVTGLGIIWSVGSGGAAVAPFLTGLLAQRFGTVVLNPVCIILCAVMTVSWLALPGHRWKKQ